MKNRWNEVEAQKLEGELAQRVYSSRLLGAEAALVMHGGGNTSLKGVVTDIFGEQEDVLFVKGSGSEISLCVDAYEKLKMEGIQARVVSMPSWEIFEKQDQAYQDRVLPPSVTARVSVEMGATLGWERYTGPKGQSVGMHTFGASAPWKDLQKHFGFTTETVLAAARKALAGSR